MDAKQKAAVAKYSALTKGGADEKEIRDLLKNDKLPAKSIAVVVAELFKEDTAPKVAKPKVAPVAGASPNDSLDLSDFEYKGVFKGANFREYVSLVGDRAFVEVDKETGKEVAVPGSLLLTDEYDFIQLKAKPIIVDRFPGMKDSPKDYLGLTIISEIPIHTSRMEVRTALELNSQILNQHSMAGHGKYYFLKKG